jgi:hypothetical protein
MPADDLAAFLRACPVFTDIPARELTVLAGVAREEPYRPRDYVFMEGEPADWFCLVRGAVGRGVAVTVTFSPAEPGGKTLAFGETVQFERGRVVLITHDGERLRARSSRS